MKIGEILRIEYDYNTVDVIDVVNAALQEHGFKFEWIDELNDDGSDRYVLTALPATAIQKT
jgi:hypothetical protein